MAIASSSPSEELLGLLRKAFYSPGEVAELASVSNSTILNYIHEGKLASVKLSERTYRIPRKAVIRFLGIDAPAPILTERPSQAVDF
jgi:excisionase family DNA binding protein